MKRFVSVVLCVLAAAAGAAQTHVQIETIAARPDDVATIDGMIKAWYGVITGPAGKAREWARDKTLYIPDVRFVSVGVGKDGQPSTAIMDHQNYVDRVDAWMVKTGFFEKEIHRVTERFGPIVHVWSTYESREQENGPVTMRGINSIELFWDGKRWWIANGVWTDETKDTPIPKEYLPK
jgi:hypothetical protein